MAFTRNSRIPLLTILFISVSWVYNIKAQIIISAEIRPRIELDKGVGSPIADEDRSRYFSTQRSRLAFKFIDPKFELKLGIQDIRVWGSENISSATGQFGSTSGIDLYEAWLGINFNNTSKLIIGRQKFAFDNQRLMAGRNWNQYGLLYDAVSFNINREKWQFNIGLSYNNMMNEFSGKPIFSEGLFNLSNRIKSFNFIRYHNKLSEHLKLTNLYIASGFNNQDDPGKLFFTSTYGIISVFEKGGLIISADAYYQWGKAQSGKDVSAYAYGIDAKYKIGQTTVGLGFDYLSGDNAQNEDYGVKEKTFNKLYGAGFIFHGWMNQYTYIRAHTQNGGLVNLFPYVEYDINESHKLDTQLFFYSTANSIQIENRIIDDKDLGSEFGIRYTYRYTQDFTFNVGYSHYFDTQTFRDIKAGGNDIKSPSWLWVMFTFTPEHIVSK